MAMNNSLDLELIKIYCSVYMLNWRTLADTCEEPRATLEILPILTEIQVFGVTLACYIASLYIIIYHYNLYSIQYESLS